MKHDLSNKTIAILATDGFEQVEMTRPREAIEEAGATTHLISPAGGKIRGFHHMEEGDSFDVDRTLDDVTADDYDGLLLPGGVHNPDALRTDESAVAFVRSFFEQHKPVAAICHGPWTLVEAGVADGRTMTSWPSLRTDIQNAGGSWVDREVVVDNGLVTSRNPDDLDAFCASAVAAFADWASKEQAA
ncbi:MAG: type 1 glutamine amidotransferase [Verrucomicrobiae bacterium]|nr:type 1 glutamine amidotransferase [Verrucomicrobiae bacterium]